MGLPWCKSTRTFLCTGLYLSNNGLLFIKSSSMNSYCTPLSFKAHSTLAEKRLSADTINFAASGSSVSKGESLLDTVNNILSMKVDMVVMRHSASGAPHFLAKHIQAAIVNAGDGINEHPTQALLDAFSIREKLGSLEGRSEERRVGKEC